MEQEIWKEITGYEGYFEVSNLGNFRSKDRQVPSRWGGTRYYPGKSLKVEEMQDGYKRIVLMKDSIRKRYMCHRLVAEMFVPNLDNKPYVNHINGNRGDNCATNLEWCTQSENEQHAVHSLGKTMKGKTNPKPVKCIELDKCFPSMKAAVEFIGKPACNEGIKKAINAGRKYHGYTFIFI